MTQSWNDLSPLHIASCLFGKGSASMVNLLLEYGADPLQGIEYSQFIRMKQLPQGSQQQQRKVKRQVGSDAKKIPEEIKETLKGRMVYPLDLGVAVRNRDVVALFLSRMSKEAVTQNRFCLVIRQDLEILGALLDAGADVVQTNQRYSCFFFFFFFFLKTISKASCFIFDCLLFSRGSSILHLAARRGDCDIIRFALHFKAPINLRGERNW